MPRETPQETSCGLSPLKNKAGILTGKVFLNDILIHPEGRFPMKAIG